MAKLLISYDLRVPGRNYQPLYDRLKAWGAFRVLESVWTTNTTSNASGVRDDLKNHIDSNDGLLVVGLDGSGAWNELISSSGPRLKTMLEA